MDSSRVGSVPTTALKLGLTVVPFGGGQTERQVQLIRDFGASIIMVTPSYMLAIADEFERQGLDPAGSSLRIGIFGAEPWTNEMRTEIERRMRIDAVDIYGLSEVMGPGVANECIETKDGPTIWEDHFFPEIIDPDTGVPLPDGEFGELVFTSLTKRRCPSSATGHATSRDFCPVRHARCGECRKLRAGRMT